MRSHPSILDEESEGDRIKTSKLAIAKMYLNQGTEFQIDIY
ncbi:hypothetical protein [Dendronalium phyllosphericum]|jgi:hypothetical protein|nr:hypothetical protein [Dendronalium phyllosphericum]